MRRKGKKRSFASELEKIGIDIALLERNLKLPYENRLIEHQRAYELVLELTKAGKKLREKSK